MSRKKFPDMRSVVSAALCAAVLMALIVPSIAPKVHAESASKDFKSGQAAEERDDIDAAYNFYLKAFQKDSKDGRYKTSYERLKFSAAAMHTKRGEKLRDQGDFVGAMTEFMHALEIDPSQELAQQDIDATKRAMGKPEVRSETSVTPTELNELGEMSSPVRLRPVSNEPITISSVQDSKIIYETVGKLAGINVLFDPDYNGKRIQVDLSNVSLYDALHIIGTISGTFWRPITANTIFVAANTRAKRTELDEQAVQTFYLSNASQQNDLNDVSTALRNVLTNAKIYGVPSQNAIVMRATPDELMLAQKLVNDLDKARPEVVVDVAVLEVNRNLMRQIGIQLPQTVSVSITTPTTTASTTSTTTTTTTGSTTSNNLTLNNIAHLNANDFAVTIGQAQANLLLSDSDTKVLQNPRLRATDGQQATMKIGSRIPIATGSFSNGVGGSALGGIGAVQTQFQYIDVGVNIDMKPTIHYNRDVTLKLKIEISSESGSTTISGVTEPIISQRTVDQVIRLREGEVNLLGGLLDEEKDKSISGWPGLGEIPFLKYLFSTISTTKIDDEIVFLLIPHVVRGAELTPLNLETIDTGTTGGFEIRRKQASEDGTAPQATSSAVPAASNAVAAASAGNGGVTGQTAAVAAGSALNAMRNQANSNPGTPVSLQLVAPPAPQKVGSNFEVSVNLSGGHDIFSVPMQVQYDQNKLTLINVDAGNYLGGGDGQAVALVHRDDGNGGVAISASRPPGVAGVNGNGQVCVLTFQAKAPGDATVAITRPGAKNSAQQSLPVSGSQATVHIQ
jgi:general secretion pathway protein D